MTKTKLTWHDFSGSDDGDHHGFFIAEDIEMLGNFYVEHWQAIDGDHSVYTGKTDSNFDPIYKTIVDGRAYLYHSGYVDINDNWFTDDLESIESCFGMIWNESNDLDKVYALWNYYNRENFGAHDQIIDVLQACNLCRKYDKLAK